MVNIFIQRGGTKSYLENLDKTFFNPVVRQKRAQISKLLEKKVKPENLRYIWAGRSNIGSYYEQMEVGDYVVFFRKSPFVGYTRVEKKIRDLVEDEKVLSKIAQILWHDPDFTYIWSMNQPHYFDERREKVEQILGKKVTEIFGRGNRSGFKIIPRELVRKHKSADKLINRVASSFDETKSRVTIRPPAAGGVSNSLREAYSYISSKGFTYEIKDVVNFYLSLRAKPFILLAGVSGTGKTAFARLFAEAFGCESKLVAVKSNWTDSSDLLGYVGLDDKFHPSEVTEFLKEAIESPAIPHLLILDEMNLARVEHYFSEFLSKIETRKLRREEIITDSIFSDQEFPKEEDKNRYSDIYFPENFYVIGTVNMDETTHPFSRKVLDRANTIEFNKVNLPFQEISATGEAQPKKNDFFKPEFVVLKDVYGKDPGFFDSIITEIEEINAILKEADLQIGYRVRDEICFYMYYWQEVQGLLSRDEAVDLQIHQNILPRIQGSSGLLREVLVKLFGHCTGCDLDLEADYIEEARNYVSNPDNEIKYRYSAEKVAFMLRRLKEDGFTSFWM